MTELSRREGAGGEDSGRVLTDLQVAQGVVSGVLVAVWDAIPSDRRESELERIIEGSYGERGEQVARQFFDYYRNPSPLYNLGMAVDLSVDGIRLQITGLLEAFRDLPDSNKESMVADILERLNQ